MEFSVDYYIEIFRLTIELRALIKQKIITIIGSSGVKSTFEVIDPLELTVFGSISRTRP